MPSVKIVFLILILILQPISSYGQEFYYGLSFGHGSLRENPPTTDPDEIAAGLSAPDGLSLVGEPTARFIFDTSDKDLNWKIYGGYNFNRYMGVEGGYIKFGKSIISSTLSGSITATLPDPLVGTQTSQATLTTQTTMNNKGFMLNGFFSYPFVDKFNRSRFAVFAKTGIYRWNTGGLNRQVLTPFTFQTEEDMEAPEPEREFGLFKDGNSGINFIVGGGADIMITNSLGVRGEWSHYRGINGRSLNQITAGLIYKFQL